MDDWVFLKFFFFSVQHFGYFVWLLISLQALQGRDGGGGGVYYDYSTMTYVQLCYEMNVPILYKADHKRCFD